jgi:hypothetical protein
MATRQSSSELSRCGSDGVWRLDYLETGVLAASEWVPSASGTSMHDSVRKSGHHLHPVRAWFIVTFILLSVGAIAATFLIQWKWG